MWVVQGVQTSGHAALMQMDFKRAVSVMHNGFAGGVCDWDVHGVPFLS
jgi:hypothetical protein